MSIIKAWRLFLTSVAACLLFLSFSLFSSVPLFFAVLTIYTSSMFFLSRFTHFGRQLRQNMIDDEQLVIRRLRNRIEIFLVRPTSNLTQLQLRESFSIARKKLPFFMNIGNLKLEENLDLRDELEAVFREVLVEFPFERELYNFISSVVKEYQCISSRNMYEITLHAVERNPSYSIPKQVAYDWGIKYYHKNHKGKLTLEHERYYHERVMGGIVIRSNFNRPSFWQGEAL